MSLQLGGKDLSEKSRSEDDEYGDILTLITFFKNLLSPGLRNSIIKNRVRIEERVYTGFDTEYTNIDYGKNELLCATTSTFTRSFLVLTYLRRVSDLDFKIGGNYSTSSALPDFLSQSIFLQILSIRHMGGRADQSIDSLIKNVVSDGEIYGLKTYQETDKVLVTLEKSVDVKNFSSSYEDFKNTSMEYSLSWLIDTVFHPSHELRTLELSEMLVKIEKLAGEYSISIKSRLQKKRVFISIDDSIEFQVRRKSVFILVAHLTIADICSWKDYDVVKENFDIIQKSVVTRQRPISYKSVNIILRDTMLLAVGTGASLAALGKLYTEEGGPAKIDIDPK